LNRGNVYLNAMGKGLIIATISIIVVLFVLYFFRGIAPGIYLAGQISAFIFGTFFILGIFNTITAVLGVRESSLRQYIMTERGKPQKENNREENLSRAVYFFCLGIPGLLLAIILHLL